MRVLQSGRGCWHERCKDDDVLRGEKTGDFGPVNSQSADCVSLLLEDSFGGLAFLILRNQRNRTARAENSGVQNGNLSSRDAGCETTFSDFVRGIPGDGFQANSSRSKLAA